MVGLVYNFMDMKKSIHPQDYRLVVFEDEAVALTALLPR